MIEKTILDFLNDILSVPVYTEIPKDYPSFFYVIEKTGGAQDDHIYNSTITIKSYGETLYQAASLSEDLIEVMLYELIELDQIISVSLNSNYNFTDTSEKRYRYQAVFDIYHY